ncbi:unnamed protein product [Caenorhabditis angaria]|uniref:Transthyretin-like protein 46 n=1 Tax=Caenorhabditis angaria TaxID=860376 RepID=A0A9P1IMI4_9PELO|nr:unnamed protein product [Caenorhabditis angaria]
MIPLGLLLVVALVDSKLQNVTARGRLTCNGKPLSGHDITLYEFDLASPNDALNRTKTNANGEFKIYGEEDEKLAINPFIQFLHTCNVEKGCKKEQRIYIGHNFIGGICVINVDLASDDRYGLRLLDTCHVDKDEKAEQTKDLSVTGFLKCYSSPPSDSSQTLNAIDVRLILRSNITGQNEIIASSKSDGSTGFFKISVANQNFKYEPFVEFEHFCKGEKICARHRVKSEFFGKTYDMSNVDLKKYSAEEEVKCDEGKDQKI